MNKFWFYLSFVVCDPVERFAGAAVVFASDLEDAIKEAHRLECNPGGQVLGGPCPLGGSPPEKYRNRLLTKAEIDECFGDGVRVGDVKEELDIPDNAVRCEHQNEAMK